MLPWGHGGNAKLLSVQEQVLLRGGEGTSSLSVVTAVFATFPYEHSKALMLNDLVFSLIIFLNHVFRQIQDSDRSGLYRTECVWATSSSFQVQFPCL